MPVLKRNNSSMRDRSYHPHVTKSRLKQKEEEELLRCDDIRQWSPDLSSSCFESGDLGVNGDIGEV